MKAIWSGAITFGLVHIPVKLYPATYSKEIKLHFLHKECLQPIKYKFFCRMCDKDIEKQELVKGYEYRRGEFVIIEERELKRLPVKSTHTIQIIHFTEKDDVDPIYFERPYYVQAQEGGQKAYTLLLAAMQQTKKVAIAKFTIHQREHLCALRPLNDMLVLESMFWHLQLREREVVEKEQIEEEELCVAKELVERLSRKFEPNQYHDEYTEAFKELVQRKLKGLPPKQEEPTQPQRVQDLLGALKQSLESVNSGLM